MLTHSKSMLIAPPDVAIDHLFPHRLDEQVDIDLIHRTAAVGRPGAAMQVTDHAAWRGVSPSPFVPLSKRTGLI
jgi:hypothetical protein